MKENGKSGGSKLLVTTFWVSRHKYTEKIFASILSFPPNFPAMYIVVEQVSQFFRPIPDQMRKINQ